MGYLSNVIRRMQIVAVMVQGKCPEIGFSIFNVEAVRKEVAWFGECVLGLKIPTPETVDRLWDRYIENQGVEKRFSIEFWPHARKEFAVVIRGLNEEVGEIHLAIQDCYNCDEGTSQSGGNLRNWKAPNRYTKAWAQLTLRGLREKDRSALVHELVHALDWASGVAFHHDRPYEERQQEKRAYSIQMAWRILQERDSYFVFSRHEYICPEMVVCAIAMLWPHRHEIRKFRYVEPIALAA